jgi:hypothetical protein
VEVEIFPALFRPPTPVADAQVSLIEGESACFYHSDKKALLPCEGCGRFLCALCDCELKGEHFCPVCLEAGKKKGKIRNLNNSRMKYDSIALSLAILPVLFFYITIVTAPATLFIIFKHWKSPLSIVHRTRFRFVLAGGIALLQICGWVLAIFFITQLINGNA